MLGIIAPQLSVSPTALSNSRANPKPSPITSIGNPLLDATPIATSPKNPKTRSRSRAKAFESLEVDRTSRIRIVLLFPCPIQVPCTDHHSSAANSFPRFRYTHISTPLNRPKMVTTSQWRTMIALWITERPGDRQSRTPGMNSAIG